MMQSTDLTSSTSLEEGNEVSTVKDAKDPDYKTNDNDPSFAMFKGFDESSKVECEMCENRIFNSFVKFRRHCKREHRGIRIDLKVLKGTKRQYGREHIVSRVYSATQPNDFELTSVEQNDATQSGKTSGPITRRRENKMMQKDLKYQTDTSKQPEQTMTSSNSQTVPIVATSTTTTTTLTEPVAQTIAEKLAQEFGHERAVLNMCNALQTSLAKGAVLQKRFNTFRMPLLTEQNDDTLVANRESFTNFALEMTPAYTEFTSDYQKLESYINELKTKMIGSSLTCINQIGRITVALAVKEKKRKKDAEDKNSNSIALTKKTKSTE